MATRTYLRVPLTTANAGFYRLTARKFEEDLEHQPMSHLEQVVRANNTHLQYTLLILK
jgi:hypothetical protein